MGGRLMALSKETLLEGLKDLLIKVGTSILTLIRTKLLPKAEEKQCEALREASEKFIDKVGDMIDEFNAEEESSKKIRKLFLIELCVNTMEAVSEAFAAASKHIREQIDFSGMYAADKEATLVALADVPGAPAGGCGPDGCEIA